MPNLPAARDASIAHIDSLASRNADPASFVARQPAIDFNVDSPIALDAPSRSAPLQKRVVVQQTPGIIPTYYNYDGAAAGTVVGIVLGSVAGFLLIVWLFYSLANINAAGGGHISGEEEIVVRRRRNSHSGRSRRSTRTEVREYSRSPRRREQIIVEERRAPARPRSVVVEERIRVPGDDVVEVIEEHDEFRSRRGGSRRSGGGGYR